MNSKRKMTLAALAGPIFLENLMRMTLGTVNIFVLARYSQDAVSAVGPANDVIKMLLMVFGIIGIGASVTLNQYLGNGMHGEAKKVTAVALCANLAIGLTVSAVLFLCAVPVLHLINLPEELMPLGLSYMRIVALGLFTQAFTASLSAISRSNGLSKFPMYMALLTNVLNLAGNVTVIERPFGMPDFGVAGVAVSLVISEFISMTCLVVFLYRAEILRFSWDDVIPFRFDLLKKVLGIGLPSAGEFISMNASQLTTTAVVATLGASALATKIVTQNLMAFVLVMGLSIGQATMILVGHAVGAGRWEDASKLALRNWKLATVLNTSMAVLLAVCAKPILGLYFQDAAQIHLGQILLALAIALEPGRVLNMVVANALRGAGDVRYPVLMGILSMWGISVTLSYVLGIVFHLGLIGVWIAFAADEWTRGMIMLFRWLSGRWRNYRFVGEAGRAEEAPRAPNLPAGQSASS